MASQTEAAIVKAPEPDDRVAKDDGAAKVMPAAEADSQAGDAAPGTGKKRHRNRKKKSQKNAEAELGKQCRFHMVV